MSSIGNGLPPSLGHVSSSAQQSAVPQTPKPPRRFPDLHVAIPESPDRQFAFNPMGQRALQRGLGSAFTWVGSSPLRLKTDEAASRVLRTRRTADGAFGRPIDSLMVESDDEMQDGTYSPKASPVTKSSSSSSSSYLAPFASDLPFPDFSGLILPDPAGFETGPSAKNGQPECCDTPVRIDPRSQAKYQETRFVRNLTDLQGRVLIGEPCLLEIGPCQYAVFTPEKKIDGSLGKHSDVYIGLVQGKRCVLKVPKDKIQVSYSGLIDRVKNQFILHALSKESDVFNSRIPKHYNFDRHLKKISENMGTNPREWDEEEVRDYIQNHSMAFQLTEYIPDEFPAPTEEKEKIDFKHPLWAQFVMLVKECRDTGILHDLLPSNLRVKDGRVIITDYLEQENDDMTLAYLNGCFKNDWNFCAADLLRLQKLLWAKNRDPRPDLFF